MAPHRQDISKLDNPWHPILLWYARAAEQMFRQNVGERTAWRYLAAIHGIDRVSGGWPIFRSDILPPDSEINEVWNQCQHFGWYFLPWHRGYLAAFEAIVASTIASMGGPKDWKLPYWNYLDVTNPDARRFPSAFTDPVTPDGRPNFLATFARTPTLALYPALTEDISLEAMGKTLFTGGGDAFFGGSSTAFQHFNEESGEPGMLELNPHGTVHVMVGGRGGYMTNPDYAALDPLFWLHHCNIDRMWSAWLSRSGNVQEGGQSWMQGPTPRQFKMPQPNGKLAVFTPSECLPGGKLEPAYDSLDAGTEAPSMGGAVPAAINGQVKEHAMPASISSAPPPKRRLLSSNEKALMVGLSPVATNVGVPSGAMPAGITPKRLYARLENVRGGAPSAVLSISVSKTEGARTIVAPVRTVTLFGLAKASEASGGHAGSGLNVSVDITNAVRELALELGSSPENVEILLEQPPGLAGSDVTVEKVSILTDE